MSVLRGKSYKVVPRGIAGQHYQGCPFCQALDRVVATVQFCLVKKLRKINVLEIRNPTDRPLRDGPGRNVEQRQQHVNPVLVSNRKQIRLIGEPQQITQTGLAAKRTRFLPQAEQPANWSFT